MIAQVNRRLDGPDWRHSIGSVQSFPNRLSFNDTSLGTSFRNLLRGSQDPADA